VRQELLAFLFRLPASVDIDPSYLVGIRDITAKVGILCTNQVHILLEKI
jgi:hypothetical protein